MKKTDILLDAAYETSLAIWLGNMRLAKYRHDHDLPPLDGVAWYGSMEKYARKRGYPDLFKPTKEQLAVIKASNATLITYGN